MWDKPLRNTTDAGQLTDKAERTEELITAAAAAPSVAMQPGEALFIYVIPSALYPLQQFQEEKCLPPVGPTKANLEESSFQSSNYH